MGVGRRSKNQAGSRPISVSGTGYGWARKNQCQYPKPELHVGAPEVLAGWNDVEHRHAGDALRMIEGKPIGDAPAAIVSGDRKPFEPSCRISATQSRAIARFEYGS